MKKIKFLLVTLLLFGSLTFAEDGHDHSSHVDHNHSKDKKHNDHDDHKEHDSSKNDDYKRHDHGGSKAIGKGKAIEIVDEKKGFKLSKEAIKTLKLRLQNVDSNEFEISKSTLVSSKNIKGVYRFRAGFFKLLNVKILKETKTGYKLKVVDVDFGDQIVINGLGLLRVTDIYSTDKSEYGHSH